MSSFAEKIRTARTLSGQAAANWARRMLRELPSERSLALVRELERQGMPVELDLEIPSWRTERLIVSEHTIEPATKIMIPEHDPLKEEAHGWRPYRVRELQGAVLDVDSGLVFSDGRVIAQSGSGTRASRDAAFVSGATVRVQRERPRVHAGPIAPLGDVTHHYHFMLETLPRMLHAKATCPGVVFATSAALPDRYQALVTELGLQTTVMTQGSTVVPDPLILVDQPDLFWPRFADVEALRCALGHPSPMPNLRIYAARSSMARQPGGEAQLRATLEERGFTAPDLATMSVREQWALGCQAQHLVGPHGAGLTIVAALSQTSSLTELSSGDLFEGCYRRLATAVGVRYRFVELVGGSASPDGTIEEGLAASIDS